MSIPPFLRLPQGVTSRKLETARGSTAVLENFAAVREHRTSNPDASNGVALLVPGFTGSKEDFIAILAPLAAAGKRAIAVDLAGQYETAGPEEADKYSVALYATDILALIAALDEPVDLVGHSMGGLVAREVVLADPLAVRSLVLMAAGRAALPESQQQTLRVFAQLLSTHGMEAVWVAKQTLEAAEGVAPAPPETDKFLSDRFLANSPGSLLAMVDLLCTAADRTDELATVAPHTLVCFGDSDDAWPPSEQREMGAALGAQTIELADTGHSPAVERPEETVVTLMSFWGGLDVRQSGNPSHG